MDNHTLEEYLTIYALYKNLKPDSVVTYRQSLKELMKFLGDENATFQSISATDASDYRIHCLDRGLSPQTINTRFAFLRAYFNFVLERGIIETCPFDGFRSLPFNRPPKLIENDEHIQMLEELYKLQSSGSARHTPQFLFITIIKTLSMLPIRRGQAVGMIWRDVEWKYKRLLLRADVAGSKSKKDRYIYPPDDWFEMMSEYRGLFLNALRLVECDCKKTFEDLQIFNTKLFKSSKCPCSSPLSPGALSAFFYNFNNKTGVKITAHQFRHSVATEILNETGNIKEVQEALGHSNMNSSMVYLHLAKNQAKETLKKIDFLQKNK